MTLDVRNVETAILGGAPPLAARLGQDVVWPRYDGYSIANLPATFAAALGAQLPGPALPALPRELWADLANGVRRVVFVLVDALGYRRLQRAMQTDQTPGWRALVHRGRLLPLTSVFPSTTVVALSSLATGLAPAQHGFLGTRLFLREYGVIADMILLKLVLHGAPGQLVGMGLDPNKFLPAPNLAEALASAGVAVHDLLNYTLIRSGLTQVLHRGAGQLVPVVGTGDLWVALRQLLENAGDRPSYIYAYHSLVDSIAHLYGPTGEMLDAELRSFAYSIQTEFLDKLSPEAARGTLLVISADHGAVFTPRASAIELPKQAVWNDLVMMPTAEQRIGYAYVRSGRMQAARDALQRDLTSALVLADVQETLEAGLWGPGPVHPETRARLGDLLLLATGDRYLADPMGQIPDFRGMHGGLTAEEMLVPALFVRLDA